MDLEVLVYDDLDIIVCMLPVFSHIISSQHSSLICIKICLKSALSIREYIFLISISLTAYS